MHAIHTKVWYSFMNVCSTHTAVTCSAHTCTCTTTRNTYLCMYMYVYVVHMYNVHGEYKTLVVDTCFEVEEHWLSGVRWGEGWWCLQLSIVIVQELELYKVAWDVFPGREGATWLYCETDYSDWQCVLSSSLEGSSKYTYIINTLYSISSSITTLWW